MLLRNIRWLFASAFSVLPVLACGAAQLQLKSVTNTVPQYGLAEFQLSSLLSVENPFDPDQVECNVHLRGPDGLTATVPAFWIQEYERRQVGPQKRDWLYPSGRAGWKARYSPPVPGRYEAKANWKSAQGKLESAPVNFACVASTNPGYLRVSKRDPRFLEFTSGKPFFPLGQNLAFIGPQQQITLSKSEEIFGQLSRNGANYLRIWTSCEDWAMAIEARKSAWGRSWDWRPPLAVLPGSAGTNRNALIVTAQRALEVNPSHPVALRPGTRYVLRSRVLAQGEGELRAIVQNSSGGPTVTSGAGLTELAREFTTGPEEYWLGRTRYELAGTGTGYVAQVSLREAAGGPELLWEGAIGRRVRGYYNPADSYMLDEVLRAAERHNLYLQLCMLTRDVYMSSLKNEDSAEYSQAIADAKKFFRYAIGRWGYSTSVAAWEYWNEQDPGLPTDRFYTALGEFFEENDPYRHLRTTSTWGPSAKDCRHPKLDFADVHFYLRPPDYKRLRDEVDAVRDRTDWLRQHAPEKPVHLGEFGLANDKWQPTEEMKRSREVVDVHHTMWASCLSGASGSALYWWWDRLDPRDGYHVYKPISKFIADIPWTSGIKLAQAKASGTLHVQGLQAGSAGWLWFFDPAAAWGRVVVEGKTPAAVQGASATVSNVPPGSYEITWHDTRKEAVLHTETCTALDGALKLIAPEFTRDVACKFRLHPGGAAR